MRVVGVLSGTSCDAIEVCICDISDNDATTAVTAAPVPVPAQNYRYKIELVGHDSHKWEDPEIQNLIFKLIRSNSVNINSNDSSSSSSSSTGTGISIRDVCKLNFQIGEAFANAIVKTCTKLNIPFSNNNNSNSNNNNNNNNTVTNGGRIELIGSHGQTVWHEVDPQTGKVHSTLQLGESSVIAAKCSGVPVVADFRVLDVALKGQGAPLVSILDYCLFRPEPVKLNYQLIAPAADKTAEIWNQVNAYYAQLEQQQQEADQKQAQQQQQHQNHLVTHHVWSVLLNLGGIANITIINSNPEWQHMMLSFDTGPANCLIDDAMRVLYGKDYDEDGATAAKGTVCNGLLNEILSLPFFKQAPPRTTGRELFSMQNVKAWIARAQEHYGVTKSEDIISTLTQVTVNSIVHGMNQFWYLPMMQQKMQHLMSSPQQQVQVPELLTRVVVSGGGRHNKEIMKRLAVEISKHFDNGGSGDTVMKNTRTKVVANESTGDAKEAMLFAFLAYLHEKNRTSNVPCTTGASKVAVLGKRTIA